jgi:hypothetical protein
MMTPMPDIKGEHIRSLIMKNLIVWIVLISTAAMGVAVAQPDGGEFVAVIKTEQMRVV